MCSLRLCESLRELLWSPLWEGFLDDGLSGEAVRRLENLLEESFLEDFREDSERGSALLLRPEGIFNVDLEVLGLLVGAQTLDCLLCDVGGQLEEMDWRRGGTAV